MATNGSGEIYLTDPDRVIRLEGNIRQWVANHISEKSGLSLEYVKKGMGSIPSGEYTDYVFKEWFVRTRQDTPMRGRPK
jgi:hypothetical protein